MITIQVNIDNPTTQFIATSSELTNSNSSLVTAVDGLMSKMVALHGQLQGVPDAMLTDQGKEFRDTPLTF